MNIERPISDKKQILTYYASNEPALNTFSKELAVEHEKENYFIKFTKDIENTILEDILKRNLQKPGYRFFIGRR
ncbi:hypothetical protein [Campylobacter concisus]|uniref:hypothetical protein n=1 Tax=Campylobacter concisus TaxID=199 RepID=UPI001901794D|nr:hypothetical protein [Campylobacter concisus]